VTAAYAARLRTAADLSHEPDDGLRRELHDGVVYVVPPGSNVHAWRIDTVDEGEPVLQAYALDGRTRTYVQEAELGPGDAAALEHPWTVAVDMAQFVLPGPG
jgi:hypothetical protein